MANLTSDLQLDSNLKPLKSGEELSSLELSNKGNGARVSGDLDVTGDIKTTNVALTDELIIGSKITSGVGVGVYAGGQVFIKDQPFAVSSAQPLYFDGGQNTFIGEDSVDVLQVVVGGDVMMQLAESGADGNLLLFRHDTSVGFTRKEATFSTTGVIGSGGTDDTDIDFRFSNKYRLEMTGDITTMNLIFPEASGNFLLVCTTNGDHDVTNWKVYESDESAATTTDVMWAGGSVPAFTSSGVDIVSFYWDSDEQQAYGVASLAFATP